MNAQNGTLYDIPEGIFLAPGEALNPATWPATAAANEKFVEESSRSETDKQKARELREELTAAMDRREPIVGVDAEVVQRLRLGDRELRRRKQRRR